MQTVGMKLNPSRLVIAVLVGIALLGVSLLAINVKKSQPLISLSQTGASSQVGSGNQQADSKMMMPNPFSYNFVADDSLSDETGAAQVFELQLTGNPKLILQKVADALSVDGAIFEPEYSTKEFPTYLIGSQDGMGPSVSINWSGTGNWWFNDPSAYPSAECLKFETSDDGTKYCSSYAEQKPTPDLLPSKAQIISEAINIFAATGHKVTASEIDTNISEWGASAYTSLKIGGQDSPIEWSVNWGSNGKIGSVSGNSVVAVGRGEYPTISDKTAVSRMSDWRYSGQLAQSVWAKYQSNNDGRMIAYDGIAASEPSVDSPTDSATTSPEPSPSVVTVTISKALKTNVMIWDKSGRAWIVPGCILFGNGWITPVFTLEEGIVELPDPVEISPMVK
jgi:hypothetical protein